MVTPATPTKKTKPVAGALWGLLFGIGLALLAIDRKLIDLAVVPAIIVVVVGVVLGIVWSIVGPAKKAKAPEPRAGHQPPGPPAGDAASTPEPAAAPAAEVPSPPPTSPPPPPAGEPGAPSAEPHAPAEEPIADGEEAAAPPPSSHPPRRQPLRPPGHEDG